MNFQGKISPVINHERPLLFLLSFWEIRCSINMCLVQIIDERKAFHKILVSHKNGFINMTTNENKPGNFQNKFLNKIIYTNNKFRARCT
jgi:hypothetical protein